MTSRPALAASASVSASNITNAAFPPGPRAAIQERISGSRSRWLQTSSIDVNSRCVAVGRHDDAGMAALERVEERDVEQVAHPAVDPQQVERGGRDEVDRRLVGPEELPDLGDPAQRGVGRRVGDGALQHGLCSRVCGSGGRALKSTSRSIASAAASTAPSLPRGPSTCSETGSPSSPSPIGTAQAGRPARLAS